MSLVRAELRRLGKRNFTRWMLVIVLLVLGAIATTTWLTNQQHTEEAWAAAEQRAEQAYQDELVWHERWQAQELADCRQARESGEPDVEEWRWPEDCEEIALYEGPQPDWYEAQHFLPPTFEFRTNFPPMITALAALLALFGFLVGASFVGAEWRSGGMMNLLLWRPRRVQVLAAKLGTVLGVLAGLAVVVGGVWTMVFWLTATFRGVTDTMTSGAWQSFGLTGLRAVALVLAAGALGVALASLGRHTVMALGAAVAAFVVGVLGVSIAVYSAGVAFPQAWLWPTYLSAWMDKSVVLEDWGSCDFRFGECVPPTMEITWQSAGLGIGAVVVLLVGAALWHIRARDVT